MESNNKDILQRLLAGMPDETLPVSFNEQVMRKVREAAALRAKRRKYMEILGYVSGFVAMLAVCVFTFMYFDISIALPDMEWDLGLRNSFPQPDYELFGSPSFLFSLYVGIVALFLLIVDSTIRRKIERNK